MPEADRHAAAPPSSRKPRRSGGGDLRAAFIVAGTLFVLLMLVEVLVLAPKTVDPAFSVLVATFLCAAIAGVPGALTWVWTQKEPVWLRVLHGVMFVAIFGVPGAFAALLYFAAHMAP